MDYKSLFFTGKTKQVYITIMILWSVKTCCKNNKYEIKEIKVDNKLLWLNYAANFVLDLSAVQAFKGATTCPILNSTTV